MSLIGLVVVAVLFGIGTYLIQQRLLTRIVIGLALISHGVNLLIILSGRRGIAPVVQGAVGPDGISDPLPQAMVLTAIVISFGVTAFLLALALRSFVLTGSDAVEDDLEDRRIAGESGETKEPVDDDAEGAMP
jgi:multicomponent Na+:H+ antiporter subunit C